MAQINPAQDSTDPLLREAVENAYRGGYSAEIFCVRNSFMRGPDSLRGKLDFEDPIGERRLGLEGRDESRVWWSRNFGQEQWWQDGKTERLRRIPFHSLKKPAFGSLLTYEDLLKLPVGYLMDFLSCKKTGETDSTCAFNLLLKPAPQSRYGSLEVTLCKRPTLLRSVVFFDADGKRLKSLEMENYHLEGGKYLPTDLRLFDGDSLVSMRLSLRNPRTSGAPTSGRDNTSVSQSAALSRILSRVSAEAKITPPDEKDSTAVDPDSDAVPDEGAD